MFKLTLFLVTQLARGIGTRVFDRRLFRTGGRHNGLGRAVFLTGLAALLSLVVLDELPILAVAADEVLDLTVAAEHEQVIDQTVQKMTVVGNQNQRAFELFQVLFKNIYGHDVQIVGRLVHDKQVRLLHQDGQQVQATFLSTGKLADAVVQHVVREKELTQEMGVVHCLQNGLVLIELHSALTVVAYLQGLSPFDDTGGSTKLTNL
mgnify:CR=1 FL=1